MNGHARVARNCPARCNCPARFATAPNPWLRIRMAGQHGFAIVLISGAVEWTRDAMPARRNGRRQPQAPLPLTSPSPLAATRLLRAAAFVAIGQRSSKSISQIRQRRLGKGACLQDPYWWWMQPCANPSLPRNSPFPRKKQQNCAISPTARSRLFASCCMHRFDLRIQLRMRLFAGQPEHGA